MPAAPRSMLQNCIPLCKIALFSVDGQKNARLIVAEPDPFGLKAIAVRILRLRAVHRARSFVGPLFTSADRMPDARE
ncbi:MAG: hypothetical protein F9K38_13365 [Pseudorhodoplanes sp.]|nr:MAG: hypothetical protein F9K38_13365 [Pseudorhodoplanes sp.]